MLWILLPNCMIQAYYSDAEVAQVNVPGLTGDFGILPAHVPVLTCLKPGVISVYADAAGTPENYFVSSGTLLSVSLVLLSFVYIIYYA